MGSRLLKIMFSPMKLLVLAATVMVIVGVLSSCGTSDRLTEDMYFGEIYSTEVHDDSIEYGLATIDAGDTSTIVNHTLGEAPTNIQLTLGNSLGTAVSVSVKNPTDTQFGIEITSVLGSDLNIYWVAKK